MIVVLMEKNCANENEDCWLKFQTIVADEEAHAHREYVVLLKEKLFADGLGQCMILPSLRGQTSAPNGATPCRRTFV